MNYLYIPFTFITVMALLRLIEKRDVDRWAAFTGWATATLLALLQYMN